MNIRRINSQA